jgi:hypothetical protein
MRSRWRVTSRYVRRLRVALGVCVGRCVLGRAWCALASRPWSEGAAGYSVRCVGQAVEPWRRECARDEACAWEATEDGTNACARFPSSRPCVFLACSPRVVPISE